MPRDLDVWVCLPCRLLPGLNLDDFCYKVRKATSRLRTQEELVEVRQWMWNFAMNAMHLLAQVSPALSHSNHPFVLTHRLFVCLIYSMLTNIELLGK